MARSSDHPVGRSFVDRPTGRAPRVHLEGDLDIANVDMTDVALRAVDPAGDVVVDLAAARFVDSVTLSRLLQAARRHDAEGGRLVLAGARGAVRRVLSVTQIDRLLLYADSVDDAEGLLAEDARPLGLGARDPDVATRAAGSTDDDGGPP
ncbi:MAG: STAS domain-containing protein [Frankiales bacterium]|nr:STAS domain-containing protein [Frankiales bacterium]